MTPVDAILQVFEERGASQYFGEDVSQIEHALQAAALAEQTNPSPTLIAAALLHDYGHLIHDLPEHAADAGIDARHEALGQAWLAQHFSAAVTEPIRLHVDAKRYLCATESDYLSQLSPASVQSLALQGGAMSPGEVQHFESNPFFRDAVALRRFDDQAKTVGLETPGLSNYRELLIRLLRPQPSS